MKAVLEEPGNGNKSKARTREVIKREKPSFLRDSNIRRGMRIATVNMEDEGVSDWSENWEIIPIPFERVSEMMEWKDLFPEWIDEEEEYSGASCPDLPMPSWEEYDDVDMIVAKLPCKKPEQGWNRDVFRLQVHLVVANVAVRRGRWDRSTGRMEVVLLSECEPMPEIFRCEEMVGREGDWWHYRPEMRRLKHKVSMPVGSCNLALPLWDHKGVFLCINLYYYF